MFSVKNKKFILSIYIGLIVIFLITSIFSIICINKGKSDLKTSTNVENASLEYVITLNDGQIFTHEDNLSFVSSMIKDIKLKVKYHNDYDNYKDYKLSTDSILYIKPGPNDDEITKYGFLSKEIIKELKVDEMDNEILIEVDYQKYLTRLNDYISKNSLNDKTVGKLEIVTTSKNDILGVSNQFVVEISFLEEVVEVYVSKGINNQTSTMFANNLSKFKLACLFSFSGLIIVVVIYCFYLKLSKMSEYDRFMYKIFILNKSVLVESSLEDVDVNNMILVKDFKELLKVQTNISLPIVYQKNDSGCKFVIKVNNSGYYCIVNKE